MSQLEESPEDIRLRNQQEVGILLSNHGQKKVIPSSEIFSNVHDLKMVAHLHEGLEWLSSRIGGTFLVPLAPSVCLRVLFSVERYS